MSMFAKPHDGGHGKRSAGYDVLFATSAH